MFASGPLIPAFAKVPAEKGCECWNRTTSSPPGRARSQAILSMLRDGYVGIIRRRLGLVEDGLDEGKLEHDLALVIGDFEHRPHQVFHALDLQKLEDHGAGDFPGAIGT